MPVLRAPLCGFLIALLTMAMSAQAVDRVSPHPLPPELKGLRATLDGRLMYLKGPIFFILVQDVKAVEDQSKAKDPKHAMDLILACDVFERGRPNKDFFDALQKLEVGQKIRVTVVHTGGGRLSTTAAPALAPADEEPQATLTPDDPKSGAKSGGGSGTSFFGVKIEGAPGADPKVLAELRTRASSAGTDAAAGRFDAALSKLHQLKKDLPNGFSAAGLETSITHLEKMKAQQKDSNQAVAEVNRLLAAATRDENDGDFAGALTKLQKAKSTLPMGADAPGLEEAIGRVETKLKAQPEMGVTHKAIDAAEALAAEGKIDEALEQLNVLKKKLPEAAQPQRLKNTLATLEQQKKYQPLLESLTRRFDEAIALEEEGKLNEAIEKIKKLKTDIPAGVPVDRRPFDEAIKRIEAKK